MPDRLLVFYDADCELCTFFQSVVDRLDLHHRITSIPIGAREADPYIGDLDEERRWASMHVVTPEGTRSSAGPALLELLGVLPMLHGVARVLGRTDRGVGLADRFYQFTVRLREGLAG